MLFFFFCIYTMIEHFFFASNGCFLFPVYFFSLYLLFLKLIAMDVFFFFYFYVYFLFLKLTAMGIFFNFYFSVYYFVFTSNGYFFSLLVIFWLCIFFFFRQVHIRKTYEIPDMHSFFFRVFGVSARPRNPFVHPAPTMAASKGRVISCK